MSSIVDDSNYTENLTIVLLAVLSTSLICIMIACFVLFFKYFYEKAINKINRYQQINIDTEYQDPPSTTYLHGLVITPSYYMFNN